MTSDDSPRAALRHAYRTVTRNRLLVASSRRIAAPQAPAWPMIGSYFCLIPSTNLAFVMISKNAVTFLKRVALYNSDGSWPTGFRQTHDAIGYTSTSPFLVRTQDMREFEKRTQPLRKFAVWRDPVGRVESTFSLFVLRGTPHRYFEHLDLQRTPSWERFAEFLEWEWSKPHPEATDEHIRRQSDYYGLADVDDVVPIEHLHAYLRRHRVPFRAERSNESGTGFRITDQAALARIRTHYDADYALLQTAQRWVS